MRRKSNVIIFFVSLFLAACAGNERKAIEIKEVFVTKIEENGLKLFSYTVTMPMPEGRSGGGKQGGMRGGGKGMGRGGKGMGRGMRNGGMKNEAKRDYATKMRRAEDMVYEKLETKLRETGYCRESYIELDKYFVKGRSQIRGECKESATKEDRIKFLNDEETNT